MKALLAAGGTGGHLFPAQALADALAARGHTVALVTDERARPFMDEFPADEIHLVTSATLPRKTPGALFNMLVKNGGGFLSCLKIIRAFGPDVAIGFGGYPTLPPMNAARFLKVPAIVHEANAVAGRANASLAEHAHVATSFPDVKGFGKAATTHVGMPVRPAVTAAARPYAPAAIDAPFHLLVFGGSQGARIFADLVPPAIAKLKDEDRARLSIVQQARPEDEARVKDAFNAAGVKAQVAPFFRDLPERMAAAHLVVSRSGAGTVAELAVIGRPSLLVPLPGALDQDQAHNASAMAAAGGAKRLDQGILSPARLTHEIGLAMSIPDEMATAASHAQSLAKPDAAEALADLVERIAAGDPTS